MPILKKTWVWKDPEKKLEEVIAEMETIYAIPPAKRSQKQYRRVRSLNSYRNRLKKRLEGGVGVWN